MQPRSQFQGQGKGFVGFSWKLVILERESSRGFAPFWVIYLTGMSGQYRSCRQWLPFGATRSRRLFQIRVLVGLQLPPLFLFPRTIATRGVRIRNDPGL